MNPLSDATDEVAPDENRDPQSEAVGKAAPDEKQDPLSGTGPGYALDLTAIREAMDERLNGEWMLISDAFGQLGKVDAATVAAFEALKKVTALEVGQRHHWYEAAMKKFKLTLKCQSVELFLKLDQCLTARIYTQAQLVLPGLLIASEWTTNDADAMKRAGITHIVSCNLSHAQFPGEFQYHCLGEQDSSGADLLKHFEPCFEFIAACVASGGKCVVHCEQGISRSATICTAFCMRAASPHLSKADAAALVRRSRPIVFPNDGFEMQLAVYEARLRSCAPLAIIEEAPSAAASADFDRLPDSATSSSTKRRRIKPDPCCAII